MRFPLRYMENSPSALFCYLTHSLLAIFLFLAATTRSLTEAETACVPFRPRSFFADGAHRSSFFTTTTAPPQALLYKPQKQVAPLSSARKHTSTSQRQKVPGLEFGVAVPYEAFVYRRWGLWGELRRGSMSPRRGSSDGPVHSESDCCLCRRSLWSHSKDQDRGRLFRGYHRKEEPSSLSCAEKWGRVSDSLCRSSPTGWCRLPCPKASLDFRLSLLLQPPKLSGVAAESVFAPSKYCCPSRSSDGHRSSLVCTLSNRCGASAHIACHERLSSSGHSSFHFRNQQLTNPRGTTRRFTDSVWQTLLFSRPRDGLQNKESCEARQDPQHVQRIWSEHPVQKAAVGRENTHRLEDTRSPMLHRALPLGTKTAVQTDGHDDTQSPPIVGLKGWLEAWLRRAVMIALSREPQAFDIPITVTESIAGARSLFDFQSSIAIALAGRVGSEQGPEEIAEGLLRNLERSEKTNRVVALTAVSERGFINVRLADRYVASQLAAMLQDGGNRLGIPRKENPRNIVVDYASPNICKELHVGHLRSAVVGDVIANLLEFAGHHVWRQNHLGDFGWPVALVLGALDDPDLQRLPEVRALKQAVNDEGVESALPAHISDLVATEMRRLEKLPTPSQSVLEASVERDLAPSRRLTCVLSLEGQCEDSKETKSFDLSWGDIYTAAHRKAEKDAEFKLGCEGILLEMQRGSDHHVARTWKKLRSMSVQGFLNIYELLRLKPQEIRGESFYAPFFPEVLAHLQRRGLLTCTPDSVLCHAGAEVEGRACGESGSLTEEYQRAQTLQSTDLGRQEQCGEKKMEALVLQKRSGTLTYAATDLAAVVFRSNVLQADQILYVVDNAQAYHFRRLFYAARQAGIGSHRSVLSAEGRERETQRERTAGRGEEGQKHDCEDYLEEPGTRPGAHKNFQEKKDESSAYLIEEEDAKSVGNEQLTGRRSVDLQHVGIGLVKDQSGGKMTSRGGGAPRLGDLLAHAITKAEEKLLGRESEHDSTSATAAERRRLATVLGISAVKYAELSTRRDVDYSFSLDKILNTKGNTAPYVLYSLVRAKGILHRAANSTLSSEFPEENRQDLADVFCFDHSALDRQLAVRLLMFPIAVEEATTSLFPSKLTAYLFSLCLAFNAFYEQCEVLGATDVAVRLSRYLLVSAFVRVLEKGLELLGIDTLDKM